MFNFEQLNGFLYAGDFLFMAALATVIIKLQLEKSSQGFSAKTQGVYGVVLCTRNIDLIFAEGSAVYLVYNIFKKITNISCIIYIVFKIKNTSKNSSTCNCNQDSFWVEALVIPCIIITAVFHYGDTPEAVLWSFSTYLEAVAMVPQFYLIQVRGKGDSYLPAYVALMATYTFTDTVAYSLNSFLYGHMSWVGPACKWVQLLLYAWYIIIPREPVMPVANCDERKRRTTFFMRQQSMLAQTLLKKTNSGNDLKLPLSSQPSMASIAECDKSNCSGSTIDLGSMFALGQSTPPTPCLKHDPAFQAESIRIKAPKLGSLKQFGSKTSLKLLSLPTTPETKRKGRLLHNGSFKSLNDFTLFETAQSSRNKRSRRGGASLPTTPEGDRKTDPLASPSYFRTAADVQSMVRMKKKRGQQVGISCPTSPEMGRNSELILRAPSYASLCHLTVHNAYPYKLKHKRTPLPTVEGSPAFPKKEQDEEDGRKREFTPSPQPQRSTATCDSVFKNRTTRPQLPKLLISAPDSTYEYVDPGNPHTKIFTIGDC